MADEYTHRIIKHIADTRYQPRDIQRLADELTIPDDQREAFARSVGELVDDGRVVRSTQQAITLPPPGREMIGVFRLNRRGFGFVEPESPVEHGDLFVPSGNTGGALTGDLVRARVIQQRGRAGGGRSPYVGMVAEILQRAERTYVGNLTRRGTQWIVEVDSQHMHDPILVRDPHAKDAVEGDKVVVDLIEYPGEDQPGEGVITEVLGKHGEPPVETTAVMRAFGLADVFPPEVIEHARMVAKAFDDGAVPDGREDLTGDLICTIDPPDARDFDDAISIKKFDPPRGDVVYELGVHIADVSNFVRQGETLDLEAYRRGNSAYLPRKVVPMLPEILSNGVCSLQEGVNRFCKSAIIQLDAQARPVSQRVANTVIRSAKRLTYLEAQALLDDDIREARRQTRSEPKYPRELIQMLKLMDELARLIRKRRFDQGMVVLDLPEVDLVFDEAGHVVDAVREDDAFTHKIIEMLMVEANEAVARLFDNLGVPMIRRIHPDPPSHDLKELRQFARVAGYNIAANPTRVELQSLLSSVQGKPQQYAVHLAVLRTLSRAEYSPMLIGHFALASEHYTHFTSPIRRYADLVVHRALEAVVELEGRGGGRQKKRLAGKLRDDPRCPDEKDLIDISRHCSQTERNAEAAEHNLTNYFTLVLLEEQLGEDFDGTVTGIAASGIYVQVDRYLIDGFIRVTDLPGASSDRWRLNRSTGALTAQRSGRIINLGDRFTVRVAKVKPASRQLDLVIIETPGSKKSPKHKQPNGAAKAHQRTTKIKQRKNKRR